MLRVTTVLEGEPTSANPQGSFRFPDGGISVTVSLNVHYIGMREETERKRESRPSGAADGKEATEITSRLLA